VEICRVNACLVRSQAEMRENVLNNKDKSIWYKTSEATYANCMQYMQNIALDKSTSRWNKIIIVNKK